MCPEVLSRLASHLHLMLGSRARKSLEPKVERGQHSQRKDSHRKAGLNFLLIRPAISFLHV